MSRFEPQTSGIVSIQLYPLSHNRCPYSLLFTSCLVRRDHDVCGDEEGAIFGRRNDVVRLVPDPRVQTWR